MGFSFEKRLLVLAMSCDLPPACDWCLGSCPAFWYITTSPFDGISSSQALRMLRSILGCLGVPDSSRYRTHDLRRGHARDLQVAIESAASGTSAAAKKAVESAQSGGEWKSERVLRSSYLDDEELRDHEVNACHFHEIIESCDSGDD